MLIPSYIIYIKQTASSLSRRVNANSQRQREAFITVAKLIKKGEC